MPYFDKTSSILDNVPWNRIGNNIVNGDNSYKMNIIDVSIWLILICEWIESIINYMYRQCRVQTSFAVFEPKMRFLNCMGNLIL